MKTQADEYPLKNPRTNELLLYFPLLLLDLSLSLCSVSYSVPTFSCSFSLPSILHACPSKVPLENLLQGESIFL